jgi:hypothetical protein
VRQRCAEIERAAQQQIKQGKPAPFNGLGYKLESFFVGKRHGPDELPGLVLRFRPTDYFTMLATDASLDTPIIVNGVQPTTLRKLYCQAVDLSLRPVPELATHFGVSLMVVTSDQYTCFSERSVTAVDPFVFFPSVAEGSSRPVDAGPGGGPDPYRTAIRGAAEELGLELAPEDITFISFGANAVLCEYALCGIAYTNATRKDLEHLRAIGVPKDKWESQRLHFVPWTPEEIAQFIATHGPWSPWTIVTTVHALMDAFPIKRIDKAFASIHIRLSQTLPANT